MTMQINIKNQLSLSSKWPYSFLNIKNNWVHLLRRVLVPPIQVLSTKGASVVAVNNTIDINHRNNLKYKMLAECTSFKC